MTTIPPEIWLHVAKFIHYSDLRNMLSVNSTFFQLAMNARYHYAVFTRLDDGNALRFLWRLRDPAVAHRVRDLRVETMFSLIFLKEYQARYGFLHLGHLAGGSWILRAALETLDNSLDEVIQAMTETITYLTNITSVYIGWSFLSPSVEHLHPFFTTSWRAIGPGLQKLVLLLSPNYIPGLISTTMTGNFMDLQHFKVVCVAPDELETQETCSTPLDTILASFINKVASTLRRLSLIADTPELKLSSLLNQLGYIPNLERLHICVQSGEYFLEDPICLSRFLQSHAATLRCFRSRTSLSRREFRSKDERSKEQLMVDFLSGNRLDEAFSNLLKLELPAPASDAGFHLLIQHIKFSASTLKFLRLRGCFLTYDKVDKLVSSFDPRPGGHSQNLALWVDVLSPDLVLLLARTCPCLVTLSIRMSYVAEAKANAQSPPNDAEEELVNARKFASRLRKYDLHDWSLSDILIAKGTGGFHEELGCRLVLLFRECIPSVQTFKGSNNSTPWSIRYIPDDDLKL